MSAALFFSFPKLYRRVPDNWNEKFVGVFKSLCRHFSNNDPYMSVCLSLTTEDPMHLFSRTLAKILVNRRRIIDLFREDMDTFVSVLLGVS